MEFGKRNGIPVGRSRDLKLYFQPRWPLPLVNSWLSRGNAVAAATAPDAHGVTWKRWSPGRRTQSLPISWTHKKQPQNSIQCSRDLELGSNANARKERNAANGSDTTGRWMSEKRSAVTVDLPFAFPPQSARVTAARSPYETSGISWLGCGLPAGTLEGMRRWICVHRPHTPGLMRSLASYLLSRLSTLPGCECAMLVERTSLFGRHGPQDGAVRRRGHLRFGLRVSHISSR